LVDRAVVEAAVEPGRRELSPRPRTNLSVAGEFSPRLSSRVIRHGEKPSALALRRLAMA
jgi:hypothetical protein